MLDLLGKLASVAVLSLGLVAPAVSAIDPCEVATPPDRVADGISAKLSEAAGTWVSRTPAGSVAVIEIDSKPTIKVIEHHAEREDMFLVDQVPSPEEIALGGLVGQSVQAWTAFANDHSHAQEEVAVCSSSIIERSFYSVAPPSGDSLFVKQTVSTWSLWSDPPVVTTTTDFWPESHPRMVSRATLEHVSGPAAGNAAFLSSIIALGGGLLGLFASLYGTQLADTIGERFLEAPVPADLSFPPDPSLAQEAKQLLDDAGHAGALWCETRAGRCCTRPRRRGHG